MATTIITDGFVDLTPHSVRELGVVVLPRRLRLGGKGYERGSDGMVRELPRRAAPDGRLSLGDFLELYQRQGARGHSVLSIHCLNQLDGAIAYARLARSLLLPTVPLEVVEARALGAGLALMVEVAARAARRGATLEQARYVVNFLQGELTTLVITPRPAGLVRGAWSGWQRLQASLPGVDTLLVLDRVRGQFRPLAVDWGLAKRLGRVLDLRPWARGEHEVWIRHTGAEKKAHEVTVALAGQLKMAPRHLERAGVATALTLGPGALEVLIAPPPSEVSQMIDFVLSPRWWG